MINQHMSAREWALLFGLGLIWGGSFFFNELAIMGFTPVTAVFLRVALGAFLLQIIVRSKGLYFPKSPKIWRDLMIMGALNNVLPFSLIVWGQTALPSGVAAIINATTPLFMVITAHFMTQDEKITPIKIIAVICGLSGVAIMVGLGQLKGGGPLWAYTACLVAAISYAVSGAFARRFKTYGLHPMMIATGQLTVSAILMLPLVIFFDPPWAIASPSLTAWGGVLGLAVLSTALAYVIFFNILNSAGATNLSLVTFIAPISAILLGVFLLGETLQLRHVIGMSFIGIGLVLIDGRLLKKIFPM